MDRIDRIQKLHRLFTANRAGLTQVKLAEEAECSVATIRRTIEEMRNFFSAPIDYDSATHSYRYNSDLPTSFALPGLWLTADELRGLMTVLHLLQEINQGLVSEDIDVIQQQVEALLDKRGMNRSELERRIRLIPLAKRQVDNAVFKTVGEGLIQRKQISIHYRGHNQPQNKRTPARTISPQNLVYYRDSWYLDAFCHRRKELRTFMLARIQKAECVSVQADDIEQESLSQHFTNSYGIFSGGALYTAKLSFQPEVANDVEMQSWHDNARGELQPDGTYLMTLPYSDERELIRDLLAYAPYVEILEPSGLRKQYLQRLKAAVALHSEQECVS